MGYNSKFLTAQWQHLIMVNYEVEAETLLPYLPNGVEIDFFQGKTYLSLVGFMFLDTKVMGIKIPFHQNFEEINLRFYVKYFEQETQKWKRGVVFIKEIVPKIAIASVARWVYGENYIAVPTSHQIVFPKENQQTGNLFVEYSWQEKKQKHLFSVNANPNPSVLLSNSEEEFITEHYWGYTKAGNCTFEYQVEHPTWDIFAVKDYQVQVDFEKVYGKTNFLPFLYQKPSSVLLAKGSEIAVYHGKRVK